MQFAGNRHDHIFLAQAVGPYGTGILAAVAGINRNNNVAAARLAGGAFAHLRHRRLLARAAVVEIQHQPISGLGIGLESEAARVDAPGDIEDDPQIVAIANAGAHQGDRGIGQIEGGEAGLERRRGDVQHDAIGVFQGQQPVLGGAAQVKHNAGVIRSAPQAHVVHIHRERRGHQQPREDQPDPESPAHLTPADYRSLRSGTGLPARQNRTSQYRPGPHPDITAAAGCSYSNR